ncbi:hypothetical protein J6590_024012 [Homalodisca vitripennis]|nr:hypothetical protein J6590_024012 [Homalodisca vitripennis]
MTTVRKYLQPKCYIRASERRKRKYKMSFASLIASIITVFAVQRSYRLIRDLIDSWVALLKHRLVSVMAQVDEALGGSVRIRLNFSESINDCFCPTELIFDRFSAS